jgi:hypothetical protein
MLGDAVALTKGELKQCELIPETVNIYPKDSPAKIAESLKRHGYIIVEPDEDPAEVAASGSSKKPSTSTMKAGAELCDDDDDDEGVEETPAKASKPAVAEFEDEKDDLDLGDDSTDDDDEFAEEETPVAKVKKAAAEKVAADESEDDEFDFEDDDFE